MEMSSDRGSTPRRSIDLNLCKLRIYRGFSLLKMRKTEMVYSRKYIFYEYNYNNLSSEHARYANELIKHILLYQISF